jgi:serine protease AprX
MKINISMLAKTLLVVMLLVLTGILITDRAQAQGNRANVQQNLRKIGDDLQRIKSRAGTSALVNVVFSLNAKPSGQLKSLLVRQGVRIRSNYRYFNNLVAITIPAGLIDQLSAFPEVSYVAFDRPYQTLGHVTSTTGTDSARQQTVSTALPNGVDGTGIGIAILDSGVDPNHTAFKNKNGVSRIVANVDFTGENRTDDPFGHGTHVASTAAGNGQVANGAYIGIAPNANIINLRVLNSQGIGSTSALLAALDWLMVNRGTYNIRVINMSLGGMAIDSYKNDPVCIAVRRLVDVGIVAVAAAGNNGKNGQGQKIYGSIHSPGNEPSAITVGATNTFGTDGRTDDLITSYSSRGPTRSFWTDTQNVKHYDNLVKPDLVAPGNKLLYAQSPNNLMLSNNPLLDGLVSLDSTKKYMYLSGSSCKPTRI